MLCPFCKEEIADGAIKCKHCQSMLASPVDVGASGQNEAGTQPMPPWGWYFEVIKKYAVFGGRAQRSEYWYFLLFNAVVCYSLFGVDYMTGLVHQGTTLGLLSSLYNAALLIPGTAVTVRRLHDVNRSGWALLILLIPIVGAIILIVWTAKDSQPGINKYGLNPKGIRA